MPLHIVTLAEVNTVFIDCCFPTGLVGCQVSGNPARPKKKNKVCKDLFESCFAECQTYWVA